MSNEINNNSILNQEIKKDIFFLVKLVVNKHYLGQCGPSSLPQRATF